MPKWNCHYLVSQQTELTQSEAPPTTIIDLIIMIKRNMDHKTFYERFHLNISTDYIKIKELPHSFLGDL